MSGRCPFSSRRGFLTAAGGLVAAASSGLGARAATASPGRDLTEPFLGEHQGGIATPSQSQTYFAAIDLVTTRVSDVANLLRTWTIAAARLTAGQTAAPLGTDLSVPAADSGEALGLGPARLTITFGFGAGLFVKDGNDRYGLAAHRPEALVDLPNFTGDQLQEARTGGDLSIQARADDPQVAFHAVRQLVRLAYGAARIRWAQTGFSANSAAGSTPRNLLGFKDGTQTPGSLDDVVWVGAEGPDWMRGGSYVVVRRIRLVLEHWDQMETDFQEQMIGRHKLSGAPLGRSGEFDALDLDATDKDGNPLIPDNAHVRLATAARRSSVADTPTTTASISPPNAGRRGGREWSTIQDYFSSATSAIRGPGSSGSSIRSRSSMRSISSPRTPAAACSPARGACARTSSSASVCSIRPEAVTPPAAPP